MRFMLLTASKLNRSDFYYDGTKKMYKCSNVFLNKFDCHNLQINLTLQVDGFLDFGRFLV
jgi:hypothetical protein